MRSQLLCLVLVTGLACGDDDHSHHHPGQPPDAGPDGAPEDSGPEAGKGGSGGSAGKSGSGGSGGTANQCVAKAAEKADMVPAGCIRCACDVDSEAVAKCDDACWKWLECSTGRMCSLEEARLTPSAMAMATAGSTILSKARNAQSCKTSCPQWYNLFNPSTGGTGGTPASAGTGGKPAQAGTGGTGGTPAPSPVDSQGCRRADNASVKQATEMCKGVKVSDHDTQGYASLTDETVVVCKPDVLVYGLRWQQKDSPYAHNLPSAKQECAGLTLAGRSWRLPCLAELTDSLRVVDGPVGSNSVLPNITNGAPYWVATKADNGVDVLTYVFSAGLDLDGTASSANFQARVRCVSDH